MALLTLQRVRMAYGGPVLLDDVSLALERGERICLVGRNGEGKSTLLRVLAGLEKPDDGEVLKAAGVRVGFLPQAVPVAMAGLVGAVVREGLPPELDEWEGRQRVDAVVARMGLDPAMDCSTLSGGQKRRALLARALASEPDVLLLDEPTNHLDIPSIEWLERFLLRYRGAVLFVTHDRSFLQRLATGIVELDRGALSRWDCTYPRYLELRREQLDAEEKQRALFDKKLAQEEVWVRQGVKARRTRAQGRVRALEEMRRERSQRRERSGSVRLQAQEAEAGGQKVIVASDLTYAWGDDQPLVAGLNVRIMRGDKVGIIGPNGCGKTTLLQLLLGRMAPQAGTVIHGTGLEIAYFDQHREALDESRTVMENVCGESDQVVFNGQRRHVISYLEDFLFPPSRARSPVRALSGGERNRLLLARLFTRPFNLLVMDEPTNDLDVETLELLEALLVEHPGTLLLVSHDRAFINNVVTGTLVFEENGRIAEYPGGYDDWLRQRPAPATESSPAESPAAARAKPVKLSMKLRRELDELPGRIEALETEVAALDERIADPTLYRDAPAEVPVITARRETAGHALETAYARWAELEALDG